MTQPLICDGRAPAAAFQGGITLWAALVRGWFSLWLASGWAGVAGPVSFTREIAPLLLAKCAACHSSEKKKGKYRLDSFEHLGIPGTSGRPPIPAGRPKESELLRLCQLADPDERMPQDGEPLTTSELGLLDRWIAEGAIFDGKDPALPLAELVEPTVYPVAPHAYPRALPIAALAYAPDGHELAVGGFHEVTVWTPTNGVLRRRLGGAPQRIYALAWHPLQPWLVVAGGEPGRSGDLRIVQTETGELVRRLASSSDVFLAAALSPDGTHLVAGGADNSVSVWETSTGRRERQWTVCADWVTALAWGPEGKRFAVASRDRTVRVCDAVTAEGLTTFMGHSAAVNALAFSFDGERIYSGGRDHSVFRWNSRDAETKETSAPFEGEVLALIPAFDGFLIAGTGGGVRYQAYQDSKIRLYFQSAAGRINALAAHDGTKFFSAAGQDGSIQVWAWGQTNRMATWSATPGAGGH